MPFVTKISRQRSAELEEYSKRRKPFLAAHPYCQIFLARNRIDERELMALQVGGPEVPTHVEKTGVRIRVPLADQIHHRNKRNGERLNREEFWMSACQEEHAWAEANKDESRAIGVLCPINAKPDGSLPDGKRCMTTDELIVERASGGDETIIYPAIPF